MADLYFGDVGNQMREMAAHAVGPSFYILGAPQAKQKGSRTRNGLRYFCDWVSDAQEMQHLIEYKLQITERTTYFADESEDKEYECSLLFVSAAD